MMRTVKAICGFFLLLTALAGCDTEQPVSGGARNASLDFASYKGGELVDVWDRHVDHNRNGMQDPAETDSNGNGILDPSEDTNGNRVLDPVQETLGPLNGFQCGVSYPTPQDVNGDPIIEKFPALWGFVATVEVFHAGALTATPIIPASAGTEFGSIPNWQDDLTLFPLTPPTEPENVPFDSEYVFTNQRRKVNTSSDVMRCTSEVLPQTNLAGSPIPFEFTLEPGDTLVVRTSRTPNPFIQAWLNNPKSFDVVLRVNGAVVDPEGITSSSAPDGTTAFSYTLR